MRKLYEIGSTAYLASEQSDVQIAFSEQLESGNIYMVRIETVYNEEVYNESYTEIIETKPVVDVRYERVFDHHKLGHPELFDSKERHEKYESERIDEMKEDLQKDDLWIHELFGSYTSGEYTSNKEIKAMAEVIKEKTGVDV